MITKRKFSAQLAASAVLALLAGSSVTLPAFAAPGLTKVRLSSLDPMIPQLARTLGYFKQEGLDVETVKVEDVSKEDYLMQEPLNNGKLDASLHWFHHVLYGAGNNVPVKAVILLNDAPGIKILVANRVKDDIRSAADFRGKKVAEGAGYSTKSVLTHYMALKAGVPLDSYTPVMQATEGRKEAVLKALDGGQVDVMAFMEPMNTDLLQTGKVTTLYDLTNKEGTTKALGAAWPAQSVFMAPSFIKKHPATVQHLVNSMVRTMRFINSHTAEEIVAALPESYFADKNKAAVLDKLKKNLGTYANGDYSFSPQAVKVQADAVFASNFDDSEEGHFRIRARNAKVGLDQMYTNTFVNNAMKNIK